jgi:DNA-binding response OmpR family regulator
VTQKQKILLIEDDEAIREMYRLKFEVAGLEVRIAEDGQQGLKLAKQFKPDLLLLDLKIPTMGGEDVLEILQTTTDWAKDMKVIIMSNISRNVAPKKLKKLKIDRYLVKAHYTPAQVVEEIRSILS